MKAFLLLLVAISSWSVALACPCAGRSLEEMYDQSKVVTHARVVSVRLGTVVGAGRQSLNEVTDLEARIAEVEILNSLKGDTTLEYVYLGVTEPICDGELKEGAEWLFFTSPTGRLDPCGGHVSRPQDEAGRADFDARVAQILAYSAANPSVGSVPYTECQVNTYQLGTSKTAMIETLGEPLPPPPGDPNELWCGVMHHGFDYDGLFVIFGPALDRSWSFRILTEGFQLRSGIGVGSSEQDVLRYYGPTKPAIFDTLTILPYQVTWKEGQRTRMYLDFTIVDEVVSRIDVHPRGKEPNIETGYPPYRPPAIGSKQPVE